MRKRIPQRTIDELLFRTDHTCSICRTPNKDVQVHHIDSNHSNNRADNLIVVCLDCHSRATGNAGLGHSFTPGELQKYKRFWEQYVSNKRGIKQPKIKYKKELISQIDLLICEILAIRNIGRIKELLNLLFELHLYRGSRELDAKIIEGLNHLSLMAGLNSARLSVLVADKTWEMCFQFVGPEQIPIDQKDKNHILSCVEALNTLGDFSSGYVRSGAATKAYCSNIWNFLELATWYNWKELADFLIESTAVALKSCSHADKLEYPTGARLIRALTKRMQKKIGAEKPNWTGQLRKLASV